MQIFKPTLNNTSHSYWKLQQTEILSNTLINGLVKKVIRLHIQCRAIIEYN